MSLQPLCFSYKLYFNLSSGISVPEMITFGSKLSSSFHSKNELLSSFSSWDILSSLLSRTFIIHILSKTSYTLATASILEKSVILTICSILSQVTLKA
ncbi:MAG: hypothetical protein LBC61_02675 [Candidatus Peribacteria bacterium]|nr:hypothetical protein [Candidatus Peribacteria bacterium]